MEHWSIGAFISTLVGGSFANALTSQLNLILQALVSVVIYVPLTKRLLDATHVVLYDGVVGGVIWSASVLIAIPRSASTNVADKLLALVLINIGFFAAGAGIGPMFPAFIVGSSRLPGVPASIGIARISVISSAGYFLGPTITGFISKLTNLPTALIYPGVALLLAGLADGGLVVW